MALFQQSAGRPAILAAQGDYAGQLYPGLLNEQNVADVAAYLRQEFAR